MLAVGYKVLSTVIVVFSIHFFFMLGIILGSVNQEVLCSSDEEFVGKAALKGI